MLVDTINKVKAISFDSSNLDAYVASLRGLSATQTEVVLSSVGLDKAQKQQILNKLAETNATISLTSAEATEALTKKIGSKTEAEALLIKAGLVTQEELLAGTTLEVSAAKLQDAVNTGLITEAEKAKIATALGLTTSNIGLGTSFKLLAKSIWASVKAMAAWLFTTPAGWATLAIGAVVGTTVAIAKYNEKLEESRQEMIETGKEAAQFTKDLDGLVEEYRKLGKDGKFDNSDREQAKSIHEQINELLGDEVSNINLANGKYEDQLKLLRDLQYTKAKEKNYDLETAYTSSKESLLYKADDVGSGWFTTKSEVDAVQNLKTELEGLDKYLHTYKATGNGDANTAFFKVDKSSAEAVVESYEKMVEVKRLLEDQHRAEIQVGGVLEDFYNNLKDEINDLSDAVTKYKDAMSNYNVNQAVIMFNEQTFEGLSEEFKNLTFATVETEEQLLALMTAMMSLDGVSDDIKYNIIGLAKTNYPEMSKAIDDATAKFVRGKISSGDFKGSLATVASQCGMTTSALATMILKMVNLNETKLNLSQQIAEIMKLRAAMGLSDVKGSDIYDAGGKWIGKNKYLLNGKEYTYNEALYQVAYDKSMEEFKKLGGDNNGGNPPPYTSTTKDKDKTNESLDNYLKDAENRYKVHQDETKYIQELQWAHDNLTKSDKERLDIIGKINEAYRDLADNRIKDLQHQIDLKKELYGENYNSISELEEIQRVAHEEAERLRKMGYDNNSNEIQALQKTWWDAESQKLDEYSKQYEKRVRDIEHSRDMALEANSLTDTTSYYKQLQEEYHKEAERLRALDPEKHKEKIQELQMNWWKAQNAISDWEKDQFDKLTNHASSYYDSQKSLLQSHYDVLNAIKEGFHEIDTELEASKTMFEWLDEDTRKLLFNEDDYNTLSSTLTGIWNEALSLQSDYQDKLENATLETVSAITEEYEMQYETLMKKYEIAKADLEIAKKRKQLDNVLNEKNVKMLINGQWKWVANTQDVINAQKELADAEYAKQTAEAGLRQKESIDALTIKQNQLGVIIDQFKNGVIGLDGAVASIVSFFGDLPSHILNSLNGLNTNTTSYSSTPSTQSRQRGGSSYSSYDAKINSMKANSSAWSVTSSQAEKDRLHNENVKTANELGLTYDEGSGRWKKKDGTNAYASGTNNTKAGSALLGEIEPEIYIDKNGHLIPINQPTLANIGAGGSVFNQEQLANVKSLWDLSNMSKIPSSIMDFKSLDRTVSENYNLYGDINLEGVQDVDALLRQIINAFKKV